MVIYPQKSGILHKMVICPQKGGIFEDEFKNWKWQISNVYFNIHHYVFS